MRQFRNILGPAVLLSISINSCKPSTQDTLRDKELVELGKYVKDNSLTDYKDASEIYFITLEQGTGETIKSGYKAMLHFNITLFDSTVIFTTADSLGNNYEEFAFYVDVSNAVVNSSYVQQIPGLHNRLKKMEVSEKAFMVIPSELEFKAVNNSSMGIPRFSTLLTTVFREKDIRLNNSNKNSTTNNI